jgi:hypothetical protein
LMTHPEFARHGRLFVLHEGLTFRHSAIFLELTQL